MLIVLEGPDWSGKSTLARSIHRRCDADSLFSIIKHKGPPKAHPLDEYVIDIADYRPHEDTTLICDRWHLGEVVYPEVLGRKTLMDDAVRLYVDLFLQARGASITILNPPLPELVRRSDHRPDDLVRRADIVEIRNQYEVLAERYGSYEYRTADDVVATANGAATHALDSGRFITYVGHPRPRVVYVGDVRSCLGGNLCTHKRHHSHLGPAFMPYRGTSGHYLMRALCETNVDRIGIVNACDADSIMDVWITLGGPRLVALGVQADRQLDRYELPHASAPHPQYVRRFHHTAVSAYGTLLSDLIGTERNELGWRPSSPARPASPRTTRSSVRS